MEDRIIELEIRYTHQQRLLDELSAVVTDQSRAIDRLRAEVELLRARLAPTGDDGPG